MMRTLRFTDGRHGKRKHHGTSISPEEELSSQSRTHARESLDSLNSRQRIKLRGDGSSKCYRHCIVNQPLLGNQINA
jgi:hypothetical protein